MKTAVKVCLVSIVAMGGCYAVSAIAQGIATATVGAAQSSTQTQHQPSSPFATGKSDTVAMPKIETPELGVSISTSDPKASLGKGNEISSGKIPESVKGVVKRLNTATEDVTLEDLNSARGAIAKLDVLIDIEKRLTDLADIRAEREEKTMASAIPASALMPKNAVAPPSAAPSQPFSLISPASPPTAVMPSVPVSLPAADVEVARVLGARGHYAALVKIGEGKPKQVREGDKISDGSVVSSITSDGVTLLKDKKKRTIKIKDVSAVFGGR